jgi:hypothetical protein
MARKGFVLSLMTLLKKIRRLVSMGEKSAGLASRSFGLSNHEKDIPR